MADSNLNQANGRNQDGIAALRSLGNEDVTHRRLRRLWETAFGPLGFPKIRGYSEFY